MMQDLLQIIHDDIKEIKKDMQEVKTTNAVQNQQLAEHMRRTKNLENRVNKEENFKWMFGAATVIAGIIAKLVGVY